MSSWLTGSSSIVGIILFPVSSLRFLVSSAAYLHGAEVVSEATFTLTPEAQSFEFKGYGFKLHVPEGSLPAEVSETQLNVRVSLSGQFQLPPNCELLSAVYWVSSPHTFMKPVTVEIQHCAALSSDKQCSQLTFVYTKCTQKELPYSFKEQEGGIFNPHYSYGILSLYHFCGLSIIRRFFQRSSRVQPSPAHFQTLQPALGQIDLGQQQQQQQLPEPLLHIEAGCQTDQDEQEGGEVLVHYCARLYTHKLLINEWKVDFIVTKDLECCSAVSNYVAVSMQFYI